jgi:hypothetical protein
VLALKSLFCGRLCATVGHSVRRASESVRAPCDLSSPDRQVSNTSHRVLTSLNLSLSDTGGAEKAGPRILCVPLLFLRLFYRPSSTETCGIDHCDLLLRNLLRLVWQIVLEKCPRTVLLFLCQRLNTATSSPVMTYSITSSPQKVTRFYFQQTSGIQAPVGKKKRLFFNR